jgi:hypothetical protein
MEAADSFGFGEGEKISLGGPCLESVFCTETKMEPMIANKRDLELRLFGMDCGTEFILRWRRLD